MSCCDNARMQVPSENQVGRRAALQWLASLASSAVIVAGGRASGQDRDSRRVRLAFCGQLL